MFCHPAHIPVPFALAVDRVLHNTAVRVNWQLFDTYPRPVALQWYREILEANHVKNIEDEIDWFENQLGLPHV